MATTADIDSVKNHLKRVGKNQRWRDEFVARIDAKLAEKNAASINALSPVQRKLLDAMEAELNSNGSPATVPDIDPPLVSLSTDPNAIPTRLILKPTGDLISPRLMQPVPEVPPGGIVEVEDRPTGKRR